MLCSSHYKEQRVYTTTCCNTLQHTAAHCNTLQHSVARCSTLQHSVACCNTLQHTAAHCNTLQHTAIHCNLLQHTATHCNTLQHTATHRNTLQRWQMPRCRGMSIDWAHLQWSPSKIGLFCKKRPTKWWCFTKIGALFPKKIWWIEPAKYIVAT